MKQKKDIRITVRLTPEQYDSISARADTAEMSPSAYIRAAAMRHRVVVVEGLKNMAHELKGIGRNLNQLTILANEKRITEVRLGDTYEKLAQLYLELQKLTEKEVR